MSVNGDFFTTHQEQDVGRVVVVQESLEVLQELVYSRQRLVGDHSRAHPGQERNMNLLPTTYLLLVVIKVLKVITIKSYALNT